MSKLTRYTQKLFGSSAGANEIAKFGSLAASAPVRYSGATVTPTLIQSLSNYLDGWFGAVIGGNSPSIEDMNAICYLFAFQLCYLMEMGIPEWDSGTTYYIGSHVNSAGVIYVSLTDANLNNAVTNSANWRKFGLNTVGSSIAPTSVGGATGIPLTTAEDTDIYVKGNASTWTARTSAEANNWEGACWSPALGLFVACASTGTNRFMTSPDGTTWTARAAAAGAVTFKSVCWSPALALFCAVGSSGTNKVNTSPDGTTWTARAEAEANSWNSVCWSPKLGLFCSVASSGTNRVQTSPDGTTWTSRSAAEANGWVSVCWSEELSIFVAVAQTGTHRIMTSPDGITWTARTAAAANIWQSVCWSPRLRRFVAVSHDGVHQVMVSDDGYTWASYDAGASITWQCVIWAEEPGLFMAVGDATASGNIDAVMTSPDGYTWQYWAVAGTSKDWRSVSWSPSLGVFAAIAYTNTSTATQVRTSAISFVTALPRIAVGTLKGQRLTLIGNSDRDIVGLQDGAGVSLKAARTVYLKKNSTLELMWDPDQTWLEVGR